MILLYHHVALPSEIPADPLRYENEGWKFTHSPEGFEHQLRELLRRGYHFVPLPEMVDHIRKTGGEPPRAVAVTFDDGWIDNFRHAFPILRRLGIPATFFVTTEHIYRGVEDARRISPVRLREMTASGITIGAHTRTHPTLTKITLDEAMAEIAGSKRDLELVLASPVTLFAYPGGAFNRSIAHMCADAGFSAACSVLGPAPNDLSSLYWMYRDTLSESMTTLHDQYRLSPFARNSLKFRVKRRLARKLQECPA